MSSVRDPSIPVWFCRQWRHCGLRVVTAGGKRFDSAFSKQRRPCDHWVLWHVVQGSVRSVGIDGPVLCNGGDSWLTQPRSSFNQVIAAGTNLLCVNFDVLPAVGWGNPLIRLSLPAVVVGDGDERLWSELIGCFDNWRARNEEARLRCRPALDQLLYLHLNAGFANQAFARPGSVGAPGWLEDLATWVDRHALDPELRPGGIVRQAGFSARHVCSAFQKHFGCSTGDFLRQRRLATAQRLIRERRDEPISTIARRCGWSDPTLFSRQFRAAFDCTPTAWRQVDGEADGAPVQDRPAAPR